MSRAYTGRTGGVRKTSGASSALSKTYRDHDTVTGGVAEVKQHGEKAKKKNKPTWGRQIKSVRLPLPEGWFDTISTRGEGSIF